MILRYWSGTLDDKDASVLAAWIKESPENAEFFRNAIEDFKKADFTTEKAVAFAERFSAERAKLAAKSQEESKQDNKTGKFTAKNVFVRFCVDVAAFAAVIITTVILWPRPEETPAGPELQQPLVADVMDIEKEDELNDLAEIQTKKGTDIPTEYAAPANGRQSFELPDGTQITLNSGSVLKLAKDFGSKTRTVTLDGEGWFDVAKDAEHPFRIRCGSNTYIVRGTTFNISSYGNDLYTVVTLHTGSLEAHVDNDIMMLTPGEELRVDQASKLVTKLKVDVSSSVDWMNDNLIFDSLPLKYVAAKLSHKYGAKINVHDSASDILYNGKIGNETLGTALKLITITSPEPLKITNIEGEYYISKY